MPSFWIRNWLSADAISRVESFNRARSLLLSALMQLLGTLKQASSRLPDEYRRMVEEAIEDFEGDAANASLSRLNEVLNGQVTQACVALMGQAYPFADSQRDMPIADFAKLFAPNGVIDRFFLQEMSPLVDITPAGWTWKEGGPLGGKLSANTLKQFERAAAIRDAFFPVGAMPQVDMNVAVRAMHPLVKTHTMHVNGQNLEFSAGINTPQVLSWPSSMAGGMVLLEVRPRASNREDELQIQGPWALRRLIMGSRPRVSGLVAAGAVLAAAGALDGHLYGAATYRGRRGAAWHAGYAVAAS